MQVVIRKFDPNSDSGIIYSSCPKGIYYGAHIPISTPKDQWFKAFYVRLKDLLATSNVYIACPNDNPDTILGYSIIANGILEFVYVKELFRNQGIGTLLTKDKYTSVTNVTKVGQAILTKQEGKKHVTGE